jgi:5-methyltetrahydropteroyltriglutamate--homocysteine methyltransferase
VVHFRGGRNSIDRSIYPEMDAFFDDLGRAYHHAVRGFAAGGCRYLQLDEVNIAYLCDPEQIAALKARGDYVENLLGIYADLINRAIAGRPADMTISMHLCRGNFRSTFVATGGYEPVAEALFNQIGVDAYFMEWDSDRAGGFEPLRFVPRGNKIVVLGLVTSKTGVLEQKDELKRRIEAASRFVPLEQLALSPQCGFASTEEGNLLTVDEQWRKLELCVEVAREVWGAV